MTSSLTGRNVVLVVLDSARADAFGAGTPNYLRLTESGLRFDNAVAPGGWTLPSHVSMFSGLSPTEHGALATGQGRSEDRRNARSRVDELAANRGLIAQKVAHAGGATFSASANPWIGTISGLDQGFNTKDHFGFLGERARPRTKKPREPNRFDHLVGIGRAMSRHASWIRSGRDKGAQRVLQGIDSFIRTAEGPFFAFTNLIETHEPHLAPPTAGSRPSSRMKRAAEVANVVFQPGEIRVRRMRDHNWGVRPLPRGLIERWKAAYRAEIAYVDAWLGTLTDLLEQRGLLQSTVVIATSDHGEAFDEKGVLGHGMSVGQPSAHIPLGMWGGGIERERVAEPISLASVAATVADIMLGEENGSLLKPGSRGAASFEIEDPVNSLRPPARASKKSLGPGAAFYDGNLKLSIDPFDGPALFDLEADPHESRDISSERSPTESQQLQSERWRARLSSFDASLP